jgi:hypothetical protein
MSSKGISTHEGMCDTTLDAGSVKFIASTDAKPGSSVAWW